MKIFWRCLILLILVRFEVVQVRADDLSGDPTLKLNSATGASANFDINSDSFFYTTDSDADVTFHQDTGQTWSNLLITTNQNPVGNLSSYTCQAAAFFTNCMVTLTGDTVSVFYYGLDATHLGILDGGTKFRIQAFGFQDSGDQCLTGGNFDPNRCWDASSTFNLQANVPEPASILLMTAGLLGFAVCFFARR
ncbi:MAG TPA: PEP-CTERM sorting domain-containing protein [Terriglobia bacterium]